jgi:hypothetical protein
MPVPDRPLERFDRPAGRLQLAQRQCGLRPNPKRTRIAEQTQQVVVPRVRLRRAGEKKRYGD